MKLRRYSKTLQRTDTLADLRHAGIDFLDLAFRDFSDFNLKINAATSASKDKKGTH